MTTTHAVDPARLQWGTWCHHADKQIGEGDIAASYSADRIGMGEPLRKPFAWKGGLWVCVGQSRESAEAYSLMHPDSFKGVLLTYRQRTADSHAGRQDPNGFYHGITVRHGGKTLVLSGPPAVLVAGETVQMDLFGGQL